MPNPYDKFDERTNHYDKFDEEWLSAGDNIKRSAGLTARMGAQAITDIPYLPFDLLANAYNYAQSLRKPYEVTLADGTKAMRTGQIPTASEQRDAALTSAGLPEPANPLERVVNTAGRASIGAGALAKLAGFLSGGAAAAPDGLASMLAARPGAQMVSGAAGGASSSSAREMGLGPAAQIGAGLIGSAAPWYLSPTQARAPLATANSRAGAAVGASGGSASAGAAVSGGAQARGTGGGFTMGSVVDDQPAGLSVPMRRVAESGKALGFRMTPGQATGSRRLQQLEAKLESQPMTSGPFNSIKEANQTALNRAVASGLGVRASVLDETTLDGALRSMQAVFKDAADDVPRTIDPRNFLQWLAQLQDDMRGLVKGVASHELIEDITKHAQNGSATGQQLQSLTSKLGNAAYKQMTSQQGDRDLGMALFRAKEYVDDLLMQGMGPERAATFQQAREHYRNLILITSRSGIVNPSSGNVSGRSLASALQRRDRQGFLFGQNRTPMYEAARFSQAFQPIVGDSGTATRMPLPSPTDFVLSLPFNLATRAYTSNPSISAAVNAQAMASALRTPGIGVSRPPSPLPPAAVAAILAAQRK